MGADRGGQQGTQPRLSLHAVAVAKVLLAYSVEGQHQRHFWGERGQADEDDAIRIQGCGTTIMRAFLLLLLLLRVIFFFIFFLLLTTVRNQSHFLSFFQITLVATAKRLYTGRVHESGASWRGDCKPR